MYGGCGQTGHTSRTTMIHRDRGGAEMRCSDGNKERRMRENGARVERERDSSSRAGDREGG